MASNINKVVYDNETLIDLTSDTVTPEALTTDATAHDKTGAPITGTLPGGWAEVLADNPDQICIGTYMSDVLNGHSTVSEANFSGTAPLTSFIYFPDSWSSVDFLGQLSLYRGLNNLQSIYGKNITEILNTSWTFALCPSLTNIHFPKLEYISGNGCFEQCSNVSILSFPLLRTIFGDYAFCGCQGLTSLYWPSLQFINGGSIFIGCFNLSAVSFPALVSISHNQTFGNCYALRDINMYELERINGTKTFYNCSCLERIVLPNCKSIYFLSWAVNTFDACSNLSYAEFPKLITLASNIFNSTNINLKTVKLGNVSKISINYFSTVLSLYLLGSSVPHLTNYFITNDLVNSSSGTIYVPESMYNAYMETKLDYWSNWKSYISIYSG